MSTLDFVRLMHAKQKLKINDDFEFIEFEDITADGLRPTSPIPDNVEMWATVKLTYTGEIPDSYRTLNFMIGDWVEKNQKKLTDVIHKELQRHFGEKYPGSETDLDGDGTAIWIDQLDYMPRIDDDKNSIIIEIELVMDTEPLGD